MRERKLLTKRTDLHVTWVLHTHHLLGEVVAAGDKVPWLPAGVVQGACPVKVGVLNACRALLMESCHGVLWSRVEDHTAKRVRMAYKQHAQELHMCEQPVSAATDSSCMRAWLAEQSCADHARAG